MSDEDLEQVEVIVDRKSFNSVLINNWFQMIVQPLDYLKVTKTNI